MAEASSEPPHACTELKAEKILVWCAKSPDVTASVWHPLYVGHRAYRIVAKGGGGRPAYARIEKPMRVVDRAVLRDAVE